MPESLVLRPTTYLELDMSLSGTKPEKEDTPPCREGEGDICLCSMRLPTLEAVEGAGTQCSPWHGPQTKTGRHMFLL